MEAFSVSGKRHPLYWLQLWTGARKMYFPGSVSLNIMSSRKLWGRPVRGRMLWLHKAFSWLHKFGQTRVSKQVCAFESEISSLLNIQHHYSYGPGKSPKSWKLILISQTRQGSSDCSSREWEFEFGSHVHMSNSNSKWATLYLGTLGAWAYF